MKWCKVLNLSGFLTCQAKKLLFMAVVIWFLILGKIQDGDHCWFRHRPPAAPPPIKYTSSCWEPQRLSTEGQIVSKYCNISKTLGKGTINPSPSPPPSHWWGCEFEFTSKGLIVSCIHLYDRSAGQHQFDCSHLLVLFQKHSVSPYLTVRWI